MIYISSKHLLTLLTIAISLFIIEPARVLALSPNEVVVIANNKANDSVSLAKYYMKQRNIPQENLITVRSDWRESCSRESYTDDIAEPVREDLLALMKKKRIRCLVTMFGIPLKIRQPELTIDDKEELQELKEQLKKLNKQHTSKNNKHKTAIQEQVKAVQLKIKLLQQVDTRAAVDSEIALVLHETYPLEGWLPNPYFLGFQNIKTLLKRDTVLMVSRLDGPDPKTVRRIIDDSLETEKNGLQGTAYFDARWKRPKKKKLSGYALYDNAIHTAADIVTKKKIAVKLNNKQALFGAGECPDTALYCGWYSLSKYVDSFTWNKGAIGYHIASGECATLKKEGSQVWCKRMLEEGAAVTIGPVNEPYVQAFPMPDIFFDRLTEGYLSIGEVYLVSLPFLSWQMVMIGDPLYQPFKPQ